MWLHLVAKFGTNASGATHWSNFELVHVKPRGWAGKKPSICANTGYPAFVFGLPVLQAYWFQLSRKLAGRFCSCLYFLESESDSLKSIQRIKNFPAFFLLDIRYRLSRNRNLKYGNRISRSDTNTWFLFRSTPSLDGKDWRPEKVSVTDRPTTALQEMLVHLKILKKHHD